MIETHRDGWSRRELLELAMGCSGAALFGGVTPAVAGEKYAYTPVLTYGPFYPIEKPAERDADLTRVAGAPAPAKGQVVHVSGRVLNQVGEPVAGARIEIWQANAAGRYAHPSDRNSAPLDAGFQGFGVLESDRDGHCSFKTVKPGAYPGAFAGLRAPHIHFDVTARVNKLVTQMFFPGEPLNARDVILRAIPGGRQAAVTGRILAPTKNLEPDSLVALWDIVLITG